MINDHKLIILRLLILNVDFQDVHLWSLRIAEEFVAHEANVNSLALGRKSGRVLVTGGDDKKVNLWAVGKPNCIMVRTRVSFR